MSDQGALSTPLGDANLRYVTFDTGSSGDVTKARVTPTARRALDEE